MNLSRFKLICIRLIFTFLHANTQDYNVRDFGALGNGITDDTPAIQAAFRAANQSNGGRVIFDTGYTFLTTTFQIYGNNVVLDVRGKILGANESATYNWPYTLVYGHNITNITFMGNGIIDGQGQGWWVCVSDDRAPPCLNKTRPTLIYLREIEDLKIYNLTIRNSPFWNIALQNANNVHIHNVRIENPPAWCWPGADCPEKLSFNTDGVNMKDVTNFLFENSYISTGDDAVAINSDFEGKTENLTIRNINVGASLGMSIGSTTAGGGVHNVTITNITMNGSKHGIHVKSGRGRGGLVSNIVYSNFQIVNMEYCIMLTMLYTHNNTPPSNITIPRYNNITITNVTCNNATYGWVIDGLNDSEIRANLEHIQITNITQKLLTDCRNIYGTCDNSTVLPSCPPCMGTTLCQDTSDDCSSYLSQCNNPTYHNTLCNLCQRTCNLCNSCS